MTIHSDSFVVHADYIPTGFLGAPIWVSLVFACGALFTLAGIILYARMRVSERSSKSDTGMNAAIAFILAGTTILIMSAVLIGGMKTSPYNTAMPFIDTIITAPVDCAISTDKRTMSSDTIVAVSELPEGQKRATFHVSAACKNAESLQQLLELDESIIPLDQQPVHAGAES